MKPNAKVFEFLSKYNYYLPQQFEAVYKVFYEQMIENLGLGENFKSSFISQMSKISSISQDEIQSRNLIQKAWKDLLNKVPPIQLFTMRDSKEIKEYQEFVEKVVFDPTKYELKFVDELIKIYETYFQSNGGTAQIIQRNRARMIICKLIWSKFIKTYDQQVQQKLKQFFEEIYARKIEKLEQQAPLMIEFLSEDSFFEKIFLVIFDGQDYQGKCINPLKFLILRAANKFKQNMSLSLEIVMRFYQIYIAKEEFLFQKYTLTQPFDEKIPNEIADRVQLNQNLKEYLAEVVCRQNQTSDYITIMKELISQDIYSKEYKSQQQLIIFLKEFEKDQKERSYERQKKHQMQERQNQVLSNLMAKLKIPPKHMEKDNYQLYQNSFYELKIFQNNHHIRLKNLQTNQEITFRSIEEIERFTHNQTI